MKNNELENQNIIVKALCGNGQILFVDVFPIKNIEKAEQEVKTILARVNSKLKPYELPLKLIKIISVGHIVEIENLEDFIKNLKQDMDNMSRGDLQGVVEARCAKTGEHEEVILKILDKYKKGEN